jgi:TRAP-type C4-dicarboxylate transport system permease small subunit
MSDERKTATGAADAWLHRGMRWIDVLLGVALLFIIAFNFINVVGRYLFSTTLLGAYEIQIFVMVWMTFLGAASVALAGEHLRMDVLIKAMPGWLAQVFRVIEILLMLVLSGFVIWVSTNYAISQWGTISTVGRIPMVIPHGAVAAGYVLMVLVLLRHLFKGGRV